MLIAKKILSMLLLMLAMSAYGDELPRARDLQQLAHQAQQHNLPLLIMFSQSDCGYCEVVRSDYLEPMLKHGDLKNRILVAEIITDGYSLVRDFNGKLQQPGQLGYQYNADISPTLVFLDSRGESLVPSLVGISSRDYYGSELDQRIQLAWQKLHP